MRSSVPSRSLARSPSTSTPIGAMADFTEVRSLHRIFDEEEEDGELFHLSTSFSLGGYEGEIHPWGGVSDCSITRFHPLFQQDESVNLGNGLGDQNRIVEASDQRYLDQVDLVLDLFDRFSSTQFHSPTNSSIDGRSGVDFGCHDGDDELGSDYLGVGFRLGLELGFDSSDWRRFPEHDYEEDYDDVSLVDEELGAPHPEGFRSSLQTFVSDRYIVERGESSVVTLSGESGSVDASSNFVVEASDVVTLDENSRENERFSDGMDGFSVLGLESDSDEEVVDPLRVTSPILSLGLNLDMDDSHLDMDDRSESDASSNGFVTPLHRDSLHLDDRRDTNDEFEWLEIGRGIYESDVLSQADSIYEERMAVDYVEDRIMPSGIWEDHGSNAIDAATVDVHPETTAGNSDATAGNVENLEWAVLLAVNDLETSNSENVVHDTDFYTGENEDFVYTAEYEIFVGQFADADNMPKGAPPASKAFIDSLVPSFLKQEDFLNARNHCTVCEEDVAREELVMRLPCSHCYHGDCILPWLTIRNTCPVCRHQLPTDVPDYELRRTQNQQ